MDFCSNASEGLRPHFLPHRERPRNLGVTRIPPECFSPVKLARAANRFDADKMTQLFWTVKAKIHFFIPKSAVVSAIESRKALNEDRSGKNTDEEASVPCLRGHRGVSRLWRAAHLAAFGEQLLSWQIAQGLDPAGR